MKRSAWISIKDKPIPADTPVLVAATSWTDQKLISICQVSYYTDGNTISSSLCGVGFGGYEWEFDFEHKDISHWRPLPKPPLNI